MLSFSALTGCKGGGGGGGSQAQAAPAAADAPTPTPSAPSAPATRPPTITGTAPSAVTTNAPYAFVPAASDPDGDALSFQIQNKPAWATFNTVTGGLTGTPGREHAGTYADIVISTSDGKATAALSAFTITVALPPAPAPVVAKPITLSWIAPTQNVDGSPIKNLAGFVISYGTSPDMLTRSLHVANGSVDRLVLQELEPGTYYFAVRALTSKGETSDLSKVIERIVS